MYDKQIKIPAKGDRTTVPDVAGKGLQVTRLDFLGSEDPKGNPVIEADGGRLSARMVVGDPIEKEFSGLVVRNPDSAEAAGTVAIVRIYEEGEAISRVPRKIVRTARGKADLSYARLSAGDTNLGPTGGASSPVHSEKIYSAFRGDAYRVVGATVTLSDNNLSSGYPIEVVLENVDNSVRSQRYMLGVGDRVNQTFVRDLIIPEIFNLQIKVYAFGSNGDGTFDFAINGISSFDKKNHYPPD